MEAKVALYPGRPILASQLGAPALVERNAVVRMAYRERPAQDRDRGPGARPGRGRRAGPGDEPRLEADGDGHRGG